MSVTVASTGPDPINRLSTHPIGVKRTSSAQLSGLSASGLRAGLFEQILSLPMAAGEYELREDAAQSPPADGFEHDEAKPRDNESTKETTSEESSTSVVAATVAPVQQELIIPSDASQNEAESPVDQAIDPSQSDSTAQQNPSGPNGFKSSVQDENANGIPADVKSESQTATKGIDPATQQLAFDDGDVQSASTEETDNRQVVHNQNLKSNEPAAVNVQNQSEEVARREANAVERTGEESSGQASEDILNGTDDGSEPDDRRQGELGDRPEKWYERSTEDQPSSQRANAQGDNKAAVAEAKSANDPSPMLNATEQTPVPNDQAATIPKGDLARGEVSPPLSTAPVIAAADLTKVTTGKTSAEVGSQSTISTPVARSEQSHGANSSTRAGVGNREGVDLSQQERVRLVQRVARSFARLGPGGGQINLRLHPAQLGALTVQVRLDGKNMAATLTTETQAARDAILESLPVLRSRLAEQGFEISQFQVEVATGDPNASQQEDTQQRAFDLAYDQQNRRSGGEFDAPRLRPSPSQKAAAEALKIDQSALVWQTFAGIDVQA